MEFPGSIQYIPDLAEDESPQNKPLTKVSGGLPVT
jgi:hypothetical protein